MVLARLAICVAAVKVSRKQQTVAEVASLTLINESVLLFYEKHPHVSITLIGHAGHR